MGLYYETYNRLEIKRHFSGKCVLVNICGINYKVMKLYSHAQLPIYYLYQTTPQDIHIIAPAQNIKWIQYNNKKIDIKPFISSILQQYTLSIHNIVNLFRQ